MQDGEQGRGEQGGDPRPGFACDRRVHGAAHHGLLDQRDGDAGAQANEENAREIRHRRCEAWRSDAQVRREQKCRARPPAVAMPIAPHMQRTLRNLRHGSP